MSDLAAAIAEQTGDPGLLPAILETADYTENYDELEEDLWIATMYR